MTESNAAGKPRFSRSQLNRVIGGSVTALLVTLLIAASLLHASTRDSEFFYGQIEQLPAASELSNWYASGWEIVRSITLLRSNTPVEIDGVLLNDKERMVELEAWETDLWRIKRANGLTDELQQQLRVESASRIVVGSSIPAALFAGIAILAARARKRTPDVPRPNHDASTTDSTHLPLAKIREFYEEGESQQATQGSSAADEGGQSNGKAAEKPKAAAERKDVMKDKLKDLEPKYLKLVEQTLRSGESVVEVGSGMVRDQVLGKDDSLTDGVMLVTDQRVIRMAKFWFQESVRAIPIEKISSVQTRKGLLGLVAVEVITANEEFEVRVHKDVAAALVRAIEEQREKKSAGNAPATVATQVDDPLEMIEKLASLRDRGILSDAEFEKKKSDLLDKI